MTSEKNETKLRMITVSGDHYTAGYKIGQKTAPEIRRILELSGEQVKKQDPSLRKKYSAMFLNLVKDAAPDILDELRGVADGAGANFDELFMFNLKELETLAKQRLPESENCTTIIKPKEDRVLVGHNEDGDHNNDLFLLKAKIGDNPRFLALCYHGWLPGAAAAVNSAGLFQTINNIFSTDVRVGLPLLFHARTALGAKGIEEAEEVITARKRARGENFIFYKGNTCRNIETSATRHKTRDVTVPYVHTNHYIEKDMLPMQLKIPPEKASTLQRSARAQKLVREQDDIDLDTIKRILADHANEPRSICLHRFLHLRTLGSVLFDTSKKELHISRGLPCKARYYTYAL